MVFGMLIASSEASDTLNALPCRTDGPGRHVGAGLTHHARASGLHREFDFNWEPGRSSPRR